MDDNSLDNLLSVTAPLVVRFDNGQAEVMALRCHHPDGLVYLPPFWDQDDAPARVLSGELRGAGPWRIGDAVIHVLGCSDPVLSTQWADWQYFLNESHETITNSGKDRLRQAGGLC